MRLSVLFFFRAIRRLTSDSDTSQHAARGPSGSSPPWARGMWAFDQSPENLPWITLTFKSWSPVNLGVWHMRKPCIAMYLHTML